MKPILTPTNIQPPNLRKYAFHKYERFLSEAAMDGVIQYWFFDVRHYPELKDHKTFDDATILRLMDLYASNNNANGYYQKAGIVERRKNYIIVSQKFGYHI